MAVLPTDQKASGVSWTKSGNDSVISTSDDSDTLSLSSTTLSMTSADARPLAAKVTDAVKTSLNDFRRSLIADLYARVEDSVRKEYSHDAMQARFGASDLDGIVSKLFLRVGPAMLASLGENASAKVAEIKTRVISQLKGENCDKMTSCVESEVRLKVYGNA
jgi:hypothetical protein